MQVRDPPPYATNRRPRPLCMHPPPPLPLLPSCTGLARAQSAGAERRQLRWQEIRTKQWFI